MSSLVVWRGRLALRNKVFQDKVWLTAEYKWSEEAVLEKIHWIIEAWGTYRQEFLTRLERHRALFNAVPVPFLDSADPRERIESLSSLYSLVVDFKASELWDQIKHRVHMVLFHERFEREVQRRGYQSSYAALKFSSPKKWNSIRAEVMREIMQKIDDGSLPCRSQDNYRDRIRCSRWHRIAKDVGWLGVFCGDFIPTGIFDSSITNRRAFTHFLRFYSGKHEMMVEQLKKHWPQSPACLRLVGGICALYGVVNIIMQICQISLSSSHLILIQL